MFVCVCACRRVCTRAASDKRSARMAVPAAPPCSKQVTSTQSSASCECARCVFIAWEREIACVRDCISHPTRMQQGGN